jgi:hypothetical protein
MSRAFSNPTPPRRTPEPTSGRTATAAGRIGREYSDELRLLLDDLGLGEGTGEPVELTTPAEVLRRALSRLRGLAEGYTASLDPAWVETIELRERNRRVSEACAAVLAGLDGAAPVER